MLVRAVSLLALALAGSPARGPPSTTSAPSPDLARPAEPPTSGRTAGGVAERSAGAARTGATAPSPEVRDQVISYLGTIDRPVSPETWRALGPAAEPVLLEVAGSSAEPPTRRTRALEGLAALGGARAEQVHLRLAREPEAPPLVRSGAVRGLGRLLEPARLATEVRPLLADGTPRVRRVAAEVLARHAPAEACADVRALAAREPGPARWSRALSACERAAGPRERPRAR